MRDQRPSSNRNPPHEPADNPFLEALFGAICRTLVPLPGENVVDQMGRWTVALRFTAAMKPRNPQEWLHAADVTMKQFSAVYSLVMRKQGDISDDQRKHYDQEFLVRTDAMVKAQAAYNRMRASKAG